MRFLGCRRIALESDRGQHVDTLVADTARARLLGLAFLRELPDEVLLFPRCPSIQTVGMRMPIDVAFLAWPLGGDEARARILDVREAVRPLRVVSISRRSRPEGQRRSSIAALELAPGTAAELGLEKGATLLVHEHGVDSRGWGAAGAGR